MRNKSITIFERGRPVFGVERLAVGSETFHSSKFSFSKNASQKVNFLIGAARAGGGLNMDSRAQLTEAGEAEDLTHRISPRLSGLPTNHVSGKSSNRGGPHRPKGGERSPDPEEEFFRQEADRSRANVQMPTYLEGSTFAKDPQTESVTKKQVAVGFQRTNDSE